MRITAGLLEQLGIDRFAIYVQDYGAPVGWRLALGARHAITAIVSQNGNGYEEGFMPEFWAPVPLQAIWGAGDGIFAPAGALAFQRDVPDAEVVLLEAGHFALESELDAIPGYMRGFLRRVL